MHFLLAWVKSGQKPGKQTAKEKAYEKKTLLAAVPAVGPLTATSFAADGDFTIENGIQEFRNAINRAYASETR